MGWPSRQYGSFERLLVALAARCRAAGADSHFVFPAPPASAAFVADAAATFHAISGPVRPPDPRFALALGRLIRRVGATHVHAHFGAEAYQALAVASLLGVPHRYYTKHDLPGSSRLTMSRTRHRWIGRRVETLFAVSDHVRERLTQLGVAPDTVTTRYLGVDPCAYRPSPEDRLSVRRELGLDPNVRVVLSTSHLRPGKGVEALPRLAAELGDDPGGVTVLAAGEGPQRAELERAAAALGLGGAELRLLGVREDVPRLLAAADLYVFTTTTFREGLPLATLEALASGVPVVASAVYDLPAVIGGAAALVPPGDPPALAAACRSLLGDPGRAAALAERGRRLVRERLSVQVAADEYAHHYGLGPRAAHRAAAPASDRTSS